jgi:hypothetical protein
MQAAVAEYATRAKRDNEDKEIVETKIDRLTIKISRLADAIGDGKTAIPELVKLIEESSRERDGLKERLRLISASNPNSNVRSLPHVADTYLEAVESVGAALSGGIITPEIVMAFQNLIDTVVVQPTPERADYVIDVYGRPSAHLGINLFPSMRSMEEILSDEAVSAKYRAAAIPANRIGQVQHGNTCQ